MDPNCFDGTSGSCPLHEAVRFFRKGVAQLLLEFGADPRQSSANSEVIIALLPPFLHYHSLLKASYCHFDMINYEHYNVMEPCVLLSM